MADKLTEMVKEGLRQERENDPEYIPCEERALYWNKTHGSFCERSGSEGDECLRKSKEELKHREES